MSVPKLRHLTQLAARPIPEALAVTYSRVRSLDRLVHEVMYDLSMQGPRPCFIGNGVRMHNSMMRGASHRWNLPVLVSPSKTEGGAAYTPVDTQTHEMLQTQWIIYLASMACAVHGMSPEEINVKSFSPQSTGLGGKDTGEKLQSSRDKGLIPLMLWLENLLNDHLLLRVTKKYRITWVGIYAEDEERKGQRQNSVLTVDEMRAIDGEEPHPDPEIGAAPVNPVHMSFYAQRKMMEQQQAMMGQQQPGGDTGGGWGDDDERHPLPNSERPLPYEGEEKPGIPQKPGLPAPAFAKAGLEVSIREVRGGRLTPTPTLEQYDRWDERFLRATRWRG